MGKAELSEGTFQRCPAAAGPVQHSPVTSFEDFGTRLEPSTSGSLRSSFLPLLLLPSSLSSTLFFSSCRLAATDALTAAATSLSSSSLQDRADSLGQTARITEQLPRCSVTSSDIPDLVLPPAEKPNQPHHSTPPQPGNISILDFQVPCGE